MSCTQLVEHEIRLTDETPVHKKMYRLPSEHRNILETKVHELWSDDVIEPSNSPYCSPVWILPKKPDSQGNMRWRTVIDFRDLNAKTIGDAYPLPNIMDIIDQLGGSLYFSSFDLAQGYHQVLIKPADRPKTAFSTPGGHWQCKRLMEGLCSAPATFMRLMEQVLLGLQNVEMLVYLDDIIIYARTIQEHEEKLVKLFTRLRQANLKLQPDKVQFLRTELAFLGHIVSAKGVEPDPAKISAVKEFPRP